MAETISHLPLLLQVYSSAVRIQALVKPPGGCARWRGWDRGGRVIETRRIRLAETVVELHGSDNCGTTGDKGQEKRGQQAHGMNRIWRMPGILAQTLRTGRP